MQQLMSRVLLATFVLTCPAISLGQALDETANGETKESINPAQLADAGNDNADTEQRIQKNPSSQTKDAGVDSAKAGPDLEAWLEPEQVKLGQTFLLRLKIRRAQGELVKVPDAIANEEVQQAGKIQRKQKLDKDQIVENIDIPLLALALDNVRTPAFKIQVGQREPIEVAAIPLQVQSISADKAQPADPVAPMDIQRFDPRPLWIGAALALLALLFFAWRWWQKHRPAPKAAPAPAPRPAHEVALEKLTELENSQLIIQAKFDAFVDEASDILRWYLGERYGFSGLDRTSSELLAALQNVYDAKLNPAQVRSILDSADMVKFARAESSAQACAALLEQIRQMIQTTKESNAEFVSHDARPSPNKKA